MTHTGSHPHDNLQAIILAGGRGSRLMPFTEDVPKPLVTLAGQPILAILLRKLARHGVRRIVLAVGHRAEQIELAVGDGSAFGVSVEYVVEAEPLGTIGPLRRVQNLDEQFLVANGDILTDLDVRSLVRAHRESGAEATIAVHRREEPIDYGVLDVDSSERMVGFREKPVYGFLVSMGIYMFNRSVLDLVPPDRTFGFDQLMTAMLAGNRHVATCTFDGYWMDIGRVGDYQQALRDIARTPSLAD